jgi:hypothetical protein
VRKKGKDYLRDIDVGGKIILKFILRKWAGRMWTEFMWLTIVPSCGLF